MPSLLVVAAGCGELAEPEPARRQPTLSPLTALTCHVRTTAPEMRCGEPTVGGGVSADKLIGGQGIYVTVNGINPSFNPGTGIWSADVSFTSHLSQAMASFEGISANGGVRVFFLSPPTNGVTVNNETGTGTFTAAGQEYYEYIMDDLGPNWILTLNETSATKRWEMMVPSGVTEFSFTVALSTALPNENGVLQWVRQPGPPGGVNLNGGWASSPSNVWVVGDGGFVGHWNGATWTTQTVGTADLNDINGFGPSTDLKLYAVGDAGTLIGYDEDLADWVAINSNTTVDLFAIDGSSANDIFVAGAANTVLWNNGTGTWQQLTVPGASPRDYVSLHIPTSTSGAFIGQRGDSAGVVVRRIGSTPAGLPILAEERPPWSGPTGFFSPADVWTNGPDNIFVVGAFVTSGGIPLQGLVFHWNGTWNVGDLPPQPGGQPPPPLTAIHGLSGSNLHIAGCNEAFYTYNGTRFGLMEIESPTADCPRRFRDDGPDPETLFLASLANVLINGKGLLSRAIE